MSSSLPATTAAPALPRNPWPALFALVVGFFMILVDTTIVAVANPAIKAALDPDSPNLNNVVWVTSAYLLTYAVPLLVTGRLGDRFGPKRIYLIGLVIFTTSSLMCGLSHTLVLLVISRAVQGIGAALMTPQTMAVITRTFPAANRGAAMGLWGAAAGMATLIGPLAGGLLVDAWGWEWIFFVNVPVGIIGFALAWWLVPQLEQHRHRFDIPGVLVSMTAVFLVVFALQEAENYHWGTLWGPVNIPTMILAGLLLFGLFIWMQHLTKHEPLVPLSLFRDRNFSVSNIAITTVGFAVTSMALPFTFYLQLARGLTPTQAALILTPMAILSGILAPIAGRILDRTDPRAILVPGLALVIGSMVWNILWMDTQTPTWWFIFPSAVTGIGYACTWGPLATTATRKLNPRYAGAGSGVYNTTRTLGSVFGSAAIAAMMAAQISSRLPAGSQDHGDFADGPIPDALAPSFSSAMAHSLYLSVGILVLGLIAVFFLRPSASSTHSTKKIFPVQEKTR